MTKRKRHCWEHSSNSPLKGVIWQCSFELLTGWDRQTDRKTGREKRAKDRKTHRGETRRRIPIFSRQRQTVEPRPHHIRDDWSLHQTVGPIIQEWDCTPAPKDGLAFHLNFVSFSRVREIQVRWCNCGSAAPPAACWELFNLRWECPRVS